MIILILSIALTVFGIYGASDGFYDIPTGYFERQLFVGDHMGMYAIFWISAVAGAIALLCCLGALFSRYASNKSFPWEYDDAKKRIAASKKVNIDVKERKRLLDEIEGINAKILDNRAWVDTIFGLYHSHKIADFELIEYEEVNEAKEKISADVDVKK